MSFLRGPDRGEVQLLPPCLDDYVAPECPARFIDAYVEGLDFQALGFARAQPAQTGRPPYHPADLLKLYLYGYLNRIRSSRRLEAEAARNLELIWLLRGVRPDFKTIADFRRDNREAFKRLFKQFNLLCRKLGLFGAELVAIDGSKFKADNNSWRHCSREQLRELIGKIESRIDEYLGQMDRDDDEGSGGPGAPSRQDLEEKVAWLQARKGRYDQLLGDLEESPQQTVSLTDTDARRMKGSSGYVLGYNVQVAVDAKHDLIVAQDVTQSANDLDQLAPLAMAAKQELGVEKLQAVADTGYHEAGQLDACEQAGVEPFVPKADPIPVQGRQGQKLFPKARFSYDAAADVYHCPAGQTLTRQVQYRNRSKNLLVYYNLDACRDCQMRWQCTVRKYRVIARRTNEGASERAVARAAARTDLMACRRKIVEHVFGTLRHWGHDRFLTRGLQRVRAEFSLSALAYNLRRVLNLLSVEKLLAALSTQI